METLRDIKRTAITIITGPAHLHRLFVAPFMDAKTVTLSAVDIEHLDVLALYLLST